MKSKLAEYAVQLRRTESLWCQECSGLIGKVIVGLSRDAGLDVSDQLRRIADTLSAYAEGCSNAMGICCSCLDTEWSQATQRVALTRGMAVALRAMATRVARAA